MSRHSQHEWLSHKPERHRVFKLTFVPLLIFSLLAQCAVVWTQLEDIRAGYFDFVLYYGGAKIINDGNGAQLYDLKVQRAYQRESKVVDSDRPLPFNHLPYELLVLLIPAKFSFPVAHMLWAAINILLLGASLFRFFPFVEASHRLLFALMLFAYFPTITALKMGQDSVITTLAAGGNFCKPQARTSCHSRRPVGLGFVQTAIRFTFTWDCFVAPPLDLNI